MYRVDLKINNKEYSIHDDKNKLISGSIKQGINSIDSFSFTILSNNIGFDMLREFKTLINVYNEKRGIYEFQGRVLTCDPDMNDNGLISKSVVCESVLGYLQDIEQEYVYEQNWTGLSLLTHLLNYHNDNSEEEKHFYAGNVFTDENIYVGIQRETTWECIQKKIIENIGGEIQVRIVDGKRYIDIVEERGTTKATTIELRKNMKSISKSSDPSSYITRLIPLGAKLTDDEGNETEERVDITSVNNGINYIDDLIAIEKFGIIKKYQTWDDVHEPQILKTKAENFMVENNKVLQKYSISYVDLALLNIDIDYIDVANYYPVRNELLGINDNLRVITKTIDIINKTSTSVEIGDNFKTLSDLEIEKDNKINQSINTIERIESNYVTNQVVNSVSNELYSYIDQTSKQIQSTVSETYTSKSAFEEYQKTVSTKFTQTSEDWTFQFNKIVEQVTNVDGTVNSNYNELVKYIRMADGTITLGEVDNPLILTLSNERMSFIHNGTEVAYISDKRLYITDVEITKSLTIGKFAFVPRANGSLDFKKVG